MQDAEQLMFFFLRKRSSHLTYRALSWDNVFGSLIRQRVLGGMCKRRVASRANSEAGNLYKVINLYNQMNKTRIEPDRKVYNNLSMLLQSLGM